MEAKTSDVRQSDVRPRLAFVFTRETAGSVERRECLLWLISLLSVSRLPFTVRHLARSTEWEPREARTKMREACTGQAFFGMKVAR